LLADVDFETTMLVNVDFETTLGRARARAQRDSQQEEKAEGGGLYALFSSCLFAILRRAWRRDSQVINPNYTYPQSLFHAKPFEGSLVYYLVRFCFDATDLCPSDNFFRFLLETACILKPGYDDFMLLQDNHCLFAGSRASEINCLSWPYLPLLKSGCLSIPLPPCAFSCLHV